MYLVKTDHVYVFLRSDPSKDGYDGPSESGVSLDEKVVREAWNDGDAQYNYELGVSIDDETTYKVFKTDDELMEAGFRNLDVDYLVCDHWTEFPGAQTQTSKRS